MAHHVLPQIATKSDLDKAVSELKRWLVLASLAVASVAIAVAKAL